mgnify:CR=1 FL=1
MNFIPAYARLYARTFGAALEGIGKNPWTLALPMGLAGALVLLGMVLAPLGAIGGMLLRLGGYFAFDSPDAALMVSLLPAVLHVRGAPRLSTLVGLVGEESMAQRAGRELVLTRLVEVLLIEALRSTAGDDTPPGLLRGLADARLSAAIRQMHGQLARSWTVAQLAKTAALSRSASISDDVGNAFITAILPSSPNANVNTESPALSTAPRNTLPNNWLKNDGFVRKVGRCGMCSSENIERLRRKRRLTA